MILGYKACDYVFGDAFNPYPPIPSPTHPCNSENRVMCCLKQKVKYVFMYTLRPK